MQHCSKLKPLEELSSTLSALRARDKKIVHCHGVFDLLHIGHIRHFQEAAKLGDVLVVTLTPDHLVNKGPQRPVFDERLRAEAIASLSSVDYVSVNRWPVAAEAIRLLRPDVYVKGVEYKDFSKDRTNGIRTEEEAVKSVGGRLEFTDEITFSSSSLLNRELPTLPADTRDYVQDFTTRYTSESVLRYLDESASLKALVVGETIIDEYQYCESMGKTGKEPILATRYISEERFAGGILAVANHVASFAEQVDLLTCLGANDSQEEFVRTHLNPRIHPRFLYEKNAPTIVKRRFVEHYPLQKLFELYLMNGDQKDDEYATSLCRQLDTLIDDCDVVIVNDYGHGMLVPEAIELLCRRAPFLAVNTQVNAANHGFNTVSKYPRADYLAVSETELRLDARSRSRDLQEIMLNTSREMSCDRLIVTQGPTGSLCYSPNEGFVKIPAFTNRIVDRVGAGDTVFAVTALCLAQNSPIEIAGVIGNAAGAEAVLTVGNRKPIDRVSLCKHLTSLLK